MRLFVAPALLLVPMLASGCSQKLAEAHATTRPATSASIASPASASAATTAAIDPPKCAPLDAAAIAPLGVCTSSMVTTPVPDLVDPTASLAPFHERMAELERGVAKRPVRIAIYGDSNLTSDFLSGHVRRTLQERYGDAGHGWVAFARPWASYHHEDVVAGGYWSFFKQYAPSTHVAGDEQYGFANLAAQTIDAGVLVWAGTTKDPDAKVGKAVSRFEMHFLKQPRGGSFVLQLDKQALRTVRTDANAFELGVETVDVDEGAHELRALTTGTGAVRFFGVSLDRFGPTDAPPTKPGIQVDSLGAGALNFQRIVRVAKDTRRAQLTRRGYDLVMIWLGTNVMFVKPNKPWIKEFVADVRDALPGVPIVLVSPGDTVKEGERHTEPRILGVIKQLREVADEMGTAFWDFREAMGGDGSIIAFANHGLAGDDHVHFGREGSKLMGDRLMCAMGHAFTSHVRAHPDAGCASAR